MACERPQSAQTRKRDSLHRTLLSLDLVTPFIHPLRQHVHRQRPGFKNCPESKAG
jgi:hypothetical protein